MAGLRRAGFKVSGGRIRQELTGFLEQYQCTHQKLEQTAGIRTGAVSHILHSPLSDVTIDMVNTLRRAMHTIKLEQKKAG